MTPAVRQFLLIAALAATLAAVYGVNQEGGDDSVQAVVHPRRQAPAAVARTLPPPAARNGFQARFALAGRDLFPSQTWYIPPPPPKPVPPPPPQAPPLPFRFLGLWEESGETVVFVSDGPRDLIMKAGDTVDGHYKVEDIGHGMVRLVYLPLNQTQILSYGE